MRAPRDASFREMPRPIPREAPVTSANLPSSDIGGLLSGVRLLGRAAILTSSYSNGDRSFATRFEQEMLQQSSQIERDPNGFADAGKDEDSVGRGELA